MARPRQWPPVPRPHKASGQDRVRIDGQEILLGPIGSEESRQAYAELLLKLAAAGGRLIDDSPDTMTVADFAARYWEHAKRHYANSDNELASYKHALRPLLHLHGRTLLKSFAPRHLVEVRDLMVRGYKHPEFGAVVAWSRKVINRQVVRIRTAFGWGVLEGIVSGDQLHRLKQVKGIRDGAEDVEDPGDVMPVPEDDLQTTLSKLGPWPRAMVKVQLLTGCRPGELVKLKPCDLHAEEIDLGRGLVVKTPGIKVVQPYKHKNRHRGHGRVILFGPRAMAVLKPFVVGRDLNHPIFSPRESVEFYMTWHGRAIVRGRRAPGDAYKVCSYDRTISDACRRAGVPVWSPGQLRHNAATRLVAEFGWDVARIVLGHRHVETTRVYAIDDYRKAASAIAKCG